MPEDSFQPFRDADERVEVDARLDPLAVEEVDEVLGGDVARGPGSERAAPVPPLEASSRVTPASTAATALA